MRAGMVGAAAAGRHHRTRHARGDDKQGRKEDGPSEEECQNRWFAAPQRLRLEASQRHAARWHAMSWRSRVQAMDAVARDTAAAAPSSSLPLQAPDPARQDASCSSARSDSESSSGPSEPMAAPHVIPGGSHAATEADAHEASVHGEMEPTSINLEMSADFAEIDIGHGMEFDADATCRSAAPEARTAMEANLREVQRALAPSGGGLETKPDFPGRVAGRSGLPLFFAFAIETVFLCATAGVVLAARLSWASSCAKVYTFLSFSVGVHFALAVVSAGLNCMHHCSSSVHRGRITRLYFYLTAGVDAAALVVCAVLSMSYSCRALAAHMTANIVLSIVFLITRFALKMKAAAT
ncbi:hypothetical protein DIPPA_22640 [Diplonema papillatum]|nr:hypothetical protein DIPPA_22640 [Diplonema papillatum]|eukprot:gene16506-25306_t